MNHLTFTRHLTTALLVAFSFATLASANDSPLAKALTGVVQNFTQFAVEGAKAMPASDYDFRPAADARSFGEIVAHLADANAALCSAAAGDGEPIAPSIEKETRQTPKSKESLLAALESSLARCRASLPGMDDAAMSRLVRFGGGDLIDGRAVPPREMPLASVLTLFTAHTSLHYGNMTTYLRIKGHVPPSSRGIAGEATSQN